MTANSPSRPLPCLLLDRTYIPYLLGAFFDSFPGVMLISVVNPRLVLMTYYGVILLMTGYQADEEHIVRQYKGIVNKCVISLVIKLLPHNVC